MLKIYSKILDVLEWIEKAFLAVSGGLMVIVIVYQVILRYIFNNSNAWSEELARYLFIYSVMIASAIAVRKNSHLQVDVLIGRLSTKGRAVFTIVSTVIAIAFLCLLIRYSATLCQTATRTMSTGVPITMNYVYLSMPIGAVLMILTSIEVIMKQVEILIHGEEASK